MLVLGINTGTSVDGVDLCLVRWNTSNLKSFIVVKQASYKFDPSVKAVVEKLIKKQQGTFEDISDTNFLYSRFIAELVLCFIEEYQREQPSAPRPDLIGLHGQTIFHSKRSTWQLGEGSIISNITGIETISNFRVADMACGGQGAPLISYLDDKLIRSDDTYIATLNIGGISNVTLMKPGEATLAYDIGPGNTLIDTLMQKLYYKPFDEGGEIAAKGNVNERFIRNLIERTEYFSRSAPKTTGRELFCEKYADKFLDLGNKETIIATVTSFTVELIQAELNKYKPEILYLSGGGALNKFMVESLKARCPELEIRSHEDFGINLQYKEALLFSLLAFTSYHKIPNNVPDSTGAIKATILGEVSRV